VIAAFLTIAVYSVIFQMGGPQLEVSDRKFLMIVVLTPFACAVWELTIIGWIGLAIWRKTHPTSSESSAST